MRDGSPFRTGPIANLADLEEITSAWVAWYNHDRLMQHRLVRHPPAEAEADYHAQLPRTGFVTEPGNETEHTNRR